MEFLFSIGLNTKFRNDHIDYKGISGKYKLLIKYKKVNIKEDKEVNDTIYQAIPIDLNTPGKTGQLMYMRNNGKRDEIDYYKFKIFIQNCSTKVSHELFFEVGGDFLGRFGLNKKQKSPTNASKPSVIK